MRSIRRFLVAILLAALLAAAAGLYFFSPFGVHRETFVDIPAGTGTSGMAGRLQSAGVIRSRVAFEILRRAKGGVLHAGEYRFDHPLTLGEVYARIARGDVYTRTVVIPEGFNIFEVAQAVEHAGLGSASAFLAAEMHDTVLISDLSPHASSLEGYLFPDTYRFSRHATPENMLAAMVKRFRQVATQLGLLSGGRTAPRQPGQDVGRTVTLASLVEKEVHQDAERPVVAGVFTNRLELGMPLATDPAVVYAALLEGRWRGTIYLSDLKAVSLYNTYLHAGLPPGPVANPGVAALRAAMHPAHTDYLYFVADAAGNTRFSVGLKEHEEQVRAYRTAEKTAP